MSSLAFRLGWAVAGIMVCAGLPARAQTQAQTTDSTAAIHTSQPLPKPAASAPTQAYDVPQPERLFGDWGGVQTRLGELGINLGLDATTEFAGNVSGGVRQGSTFANQVALQADVNLERLAGITGLSFHTILVNRSGSNDSTLFGDNLLPVQEIYGSGGDVAVHLVSIYAQETLFDRRLDVAVGRMNVENDFASSSLYCNFINNALCGDPKSLPGGDIGHSAYPDAVWAARVRVRPTPDTYVQTGVYEVNQGLYTLASFRSGFEFDTARDSGVYLPVEVGWEPQFGADKLPGHYKLGIGYDTSPGYKSFANALATASVPGYTAKSSRGNTQLWALADQMLVRNGPGDADGVILIAGVVHNDPNNSVYAEQYVVALVDGAFWSARPQDTIGLMFTYNTVSGRLGNVQGVEQALGLPLENNATGVQSREMVLEVNYDIHVARGVKFQPDFQYVIRPNAQSNIPNAAVFGFRAHVQF